MSQQLLGIWILSLHSNMHSQLQNATLETTELFPKNGQLCSATQNYMQIGNLYKEFSPLPQTSDLIENVL